MRALSLLQLGAGVAVAGVVAAGTTAFTAPGGLTNSISSAQSFVGGTTDHSIVGADLTSLVFTTVDTATAGLTKVTAFTLTFNADTPTGAVVTISNLTGVANNGGAGTAPDNFYCTTVDASDQSVCTAGTALATYNGHFTGVGAMKIKVLAP